MKIQNIKLFQALATVISVTLVHAAPVHTTASETTRSVIVYTQTPTAKPPIPTELFGPGPVIVSFESTFPLQIFPIVPERTATLTTSTTADFSIIITIPTVMPHKRPFLLGHGPIVRPKPHGHNITQGLRPTFMRPSHFAHGPVVPHRPHEYNTTVPGSQPSLRRPFNFGHGPVVPQNRPHRINSPSGGHELKEADGHAIKAREPESDNSPDYKSKEHFRVIKRMTGTWAVPEIAAEGSIIRPTHKSYGPAEIGVAGHGHELYNNSTSHPVGHKSHSHAETDADTKISIVVPRFLRGADEGA